MNEWIDGRMATVGDAGRSRSRRRTRQRLGG